MRFFTARNLLAWIGICGIFLCIGCNSANKVNDSKSSSHNYTKQSIQAIMVADRESVKAGQPLTFLIAVLNGTKSPICIDGRMAFPGNLYILVKLPDSRVISASTIAVKQAIVTKEDIVNLPPNDLYGIRITIAPTESITPKELRHPKPGVYTFWAEYYCRESEWPKCKELSLKSNSVKVLIENPHK